MPVFGVILCTLRLLDIHRLWKELALEPLIILGGSSSRPIERVHRNCFLLYLVAWCVKHARNFRAGYHTHQRACGGSATYVWASFEACGVASGCLTTTHARPSKLHAFSYYLSQSIVVKLHFSLQNVSAVAESLKVGTSWKIGTKLKDWNELTDIASFMSSTKLLAAKQALALLRKKTVHRSLYSSSVYFLGRTDAVTEQWQLDLRNPRSRSEQGQRCALVLNN